MVCVYVIESVCVMVKWMVFLVRDDVVSGVVSGEFGMMLRKVRNEVKWVMVKVNMSEDVVL